MASLEKMGHMVDAKRELDAATNIDAPAKAAGDRAVARIGETPIYLSEVEEQIQTLPPQVQKQLLNQDEKLQFVHQYVGMELMYRAAERENYGENPEVKQQMRELMTRTCWCRSYVVDKVMPQVKIDTADVRNFLSGQQGRPAITERRTTRSRRRCSWIIRTKRPSRLSANISYWPSANGANFWIRT